MEKGENVGVVPGEEVPGEVFEIGDVLGYGVAFNLAIVTSTNTLVATRGDSKLKKQLQICTNLAAFLYNRFFNLV